MAAPETPSTDTATDSERQQRIAMLRGSIKLLLGIGLLFLLVPFIKSLPWPQDAAPEGSVAVTATALPAGSTRAYILSDESTVFVTHVDAAQRRALNDWPAEKLWFTSAPGVAQQDWLVVAARSAQDEVLTLQAADGNGPAGFTSSSGARWDLAGRALKTDGVAMKFQNLMPLPFRTQDDGILLLPLPVAPPHFEDPAP